MDIYERELLYKIMFDAYKEGSFTLKSGQVSDYYIDLKTIMTNSRGIILIGNSLLLNIMDSYREFLSSSPHNSLLVGGMALGAVPITTAILMSSSTFQISGFYVRPPKDHGTQKRIEGNLSSSIGDTKVLIVEDVTTTGESAIEAASAMRERDYNVEAVFSVVDREQGAALNFKRYGLKFFPLFTISQIQDEKATAEMISGLYLQ